MPGPRPHGFHAWPKGQFSRPNRLLQMRPRAGGLLMSQGKFEGDITYTHRGRARYPHDPNDQTPPPLGILTSRGKSISRPTTPFTPQFGTIL